MLEEGVSIEEGIYFIYIWKIIHVIVLIKNGKISPCLYADANKYNEPLFKCFSLTVQTVLLHQFSFFELWNNSL